MQLIPYASSNIPMRPLYYGYYAGNITVIYESQNLYYLNGSTPIPILYGSYVGVGAVYDGNTSVIIATNSGIITLDIITGYYASAYIPSIIDIAILVPNMSISSYVVFLLDSSGNIYAGTTPYTSYTVIFNVPSATQIIPYYNDLLVAVNNGNFSLFSMTSNTYVFTAVGSGMAYAFGSDIYAVVINDSYVNYYVDYSLAISFVQFPYKAYVNSIITHVDYTFAYASPYLYMLSPSGFSGYSSVQPNIIYMGALAPSQIYIGYYENGSYYLGALTYDQNEFMNIYTPVYSVIAGSSIVLYASTTYSSVNFLMITGIEKGGGVIGTDIGAVAVSSNFAYMNYTVNPLYQGKVMFGGFAII